jgi:hypothetical protein
MQTSRSLGTPAAIVRDVAGLPVPPEENILAFAICGARAVLKQRV